MGDKRKSGNDDSSTLSKQSVGKKKKNSFGGGPRPLFGNGTLGFGSGPQFMGSQNYCYPMGGPGYGDV